MIYLVAGKLQLAVPRPFWPLSTKIGVEPIKNYVHSYDRLLYAEISTYCYNLEPESTDSFQGNLNSLIEYVFSQDYENGLKAEQGKKHQVEVELRERSKRVYDQGRHWVPTLCRLFLYSQQLCKNIPSIAEASKPDGEQDNQYTAHNPEAANNNCTWEFNAKPYYCCKQRTRDVVSDP